MHERFRDQFLGRWGGTVTRYPRLTLAICLVLAAAAIVLTVMRLQFHSDRSDLIEKNLSWNKRYADYKDLFPRWDDVLVVIEGDADDERINELARYVADRLVRSTRVVNADSGFDVTETGPRLLAAAPAPIFDQVFRDLANVKRLVASTNANEALAVALDRLAENSNRTSAAIDRLEKLLDPYLSAMEGGEPAFTFIRPDLPRWLPLVSEVGSGRLRFIQVQFVETTGGINDVSENVRWLRERTAELINEARSAHPEWTDLDDLEWGVTGIPAIEADETQQSIHDSTVASFVAFTLITLMLVLVFRGVTVPALAAGSLLIGIAWSFGWLVLTVGHLQLLSVVFTVILLGLGIDFAVHLVARLELVQQEHADLTSAVSRVFRGIGPGMITGAVTTAAAFAATALTEFKGMAEMGVIAGGGIILCLIAVLSCFPAALALTGRWKKIIRRRHGGETAHFAHGRLDFIDFHPRVSLVIATIAVALLAVPTIGVRYDPNVLNLQPEGIESVAWERRIVEDDAKSVWSALLETSPKDAARLADELRALPEVSDVGAMGMLFPADRERRAALIANLRERQLGPPPVAADMNALRQQLNTLLLGVAAQAVAATGPDAERLESIVARVRTAINQAARLDSQERARRMQRLNAAFIEARASVRQWLDEALAPEPPTANDLPDLLRSQWTLGDLWLLRIYPAADPEGRSVLHPDRLGRFVRAIRSVDSEVFGPPVQIYESTRLIVREYRKAACYALAAILILLVLDFRSLPDALCATAPVAIGFIGVFGLMGLTGMPLNFANIIVMPLIFGIGVDAGVHAVHRWRAEPFGRPAGLSGGTGRGITLTMLTTMIGFGCMLLAKHRGIRSLGFVMVAGLGVTLLSCYTVLPAILRLRTAHWSSTINGTRK